MTRGGTRIGDAIGFAVQTAFDDVERGNKALVLVTDGGDQPTETGDQQSSPITAAAAASLRGIRLVAIGIGDPRTGATVPNSETDRAPMLYRGQPVETRLEEDVLRKIAEANLGGAYLESGLDAGNVYRQLLAARGRAKSGNERGETEFYPVLLAYAVLLLGAEMTMGDGGWIRSHARTRALVASLAILGLGFQELPSDVSELTAGGDESFRTGNYTEAARNYALAADGAPRSPEILFNLANSLYREKLYGEASANFERAAELSRDPHFRARCKLGQANCAYRMAHGRDAFDTSQALGKVLDLYREAWAGDPELADAPHNIEAVKRKLQSLNEQLRSSARDFMVQSPADVERDRHTAADDILREDRAGGKAPLRAKRTTDRDW